MNEIKSRLLQALQCSMGTRIYTDCFADSSIEGSPKYTIRDITDALVKKAKEGDIEAIDRILQIADFEQPDPLPGK